jgi:hypothetical protein
MCGKPPAFRRDCLILLGLRPIFGAEPREIKRRSGKAKPFRTSGGTAATKSYRTGSGPGSPRGQPRGVVDATGSLECGGKPGVPSVAAALGWSERDTALDSQITTSQRFIQSAVAASLCRRTPNEPAVRVSGRMKIAQPFKAGLTMNIED